MAQPRRLPVVVLSGHLGAGKTTLLNHLLRRPGARIGVVVNDFGEVNVDAGLVAGQVDEPASIAGGCLCCLPDAGGLDDALARLAHPRLALDAVVVEASGLAEPLELARIVRASRVRAVRSGGVVEVVDAVHWFDTVDTAPLPPLRLAAATLVVLNKVDRLPPDRAGEVLARIEARVRERNPHAHVVRAVRAAVDPALVVDAALGEDPPDQLPIAALLRGTAGEAGPGHHHVHAVAVTVRADAPVDPGRLCHLLEHPPEGVYRIKGRLAVAGPHTTRGVVVHVVGGDVDVAAVPAPDHGELVAIGSGVEEHALRAALVAALAPAGAPGPRDAARLDRLRRLSGPGRR